MDYYINDNYIHIKDKSRYILIDRNTRKEVYLGIAEYKIYINLQKARTISELATLAEYKGSESEIVEMIEEFRKHGLFENKYKKFSLIKYFTVFKFDGYKISISDKLLKVIYVFLFSLVLISLFFGIRFIKDHIKIIMHNFDNLPQFTFIIYMVLFMTIHEIGHLVFGIIFKKRIVDVGIKMFLLLPLGMYASFCGLKTEKNSWGNYFTSAGGILFNIIVIGILSFIETLFNIQSDIIYASIAINIIILSVNCLLFYPFDGYYMLLNDNSSRLKNFKKDFFYHLLIIGYCITTYFYLNIFSSIVLYFVLFALLFILRYSLIRKKENYLYVDIAISLLITLYYINHSIGVNSGILSRLIYSIFSISFLTLTFDLIKRICIHVLSLLIKRSISDDSNR